MKGIVQRVKIAAATLVIVIAAAQVLSAASPAAVLITSVEGNVSYLPAASAKPVKTAANRAMTQGDTVVVTGPGNAEVLVRDGSVLRIADGSRLKVLSIERRAVHVLLESGRIWVNCAGLPGYPLFVSTPSAEVDALERAVFRIDIDGASGDANVSVLTGQTAVVQPKGRMAIAAGTRLVMRADGSEPVYTRIGPPDAWDAWNRKKDGTVSPPPPGARRDPSVSSSPPPAATVPPPAAYPPPPPPQTVREYVYVAPYPAWGYSWSFGYDPYPYGWRGPYWPGWGPYYYPYGRPYYRYHGWGRPGYGYRGHGGPYRGYGGPHGGRHHR